MTLNDYINYLEKNLEGIPEEEKQNAVEYWREYFSEVPENELEKEMEKVGTPYNLANQIKKDAGYNTVSASDLPKTDNTEKKSVNIANIILLILLSPIWISVFAIIFSVAISLIAVLLSLAIGLPVMGMTTLIAAFYVAKYNPYSAIFNIGIGILCIGVAILLEKRFFIWMKDIIVLYCKLIKTFFVKIFRCFK